MTAYAHIDDYLQQWLARVPAAGVALAITTPAHTLHTAHVGYRDYAAGYPVSPATTFQIGSIGKSMTALALMQLVESRRLDLNAPLSSHLPWFAPSSRFGPIALKHVMSHTAGLPAGADFTPASRYEAYALRDVDVAWEPGARFHYSNTGYKLLGWLLEDVAHAPYGTILTRQVLAHLGMTATDAVVTHHTHPRQAVGYTPLHDDRPYRFGDTLLPATWMEYAAGDGSPAATAGDLARYARLWLNRGRGPQRPIVSPASFDRIIRPSIRMERGAAYEHDYGYGFGIISHTADGHRFIGHGGSTVGFQAIMLVDLTTGLAAALLCNGTGLDTYAPARYALQVAAATRDGTAIPPPPELPDPERVTAAPRYAGKYTAPDGRRLHIHPDGNKLRAHLATPANPDAAGPITLQHINGNTFCAPHDAFDPFPLRFRTTPDDIAAGTMIEVWHGPTVYVREGSAPLEEPAISPPGYAALPGHYRSHAPYVSNFRIILRRGRPYLCWPNGGEERLTPRNPSDTTSGWFTVGPPGTPSAEQLRFDPIVGPTALRVRWTGGGDFYRVD